MLTPRQVAERYQVSLPTVMRWVQDGEIGYLRLGRKHLVRFTEAHLAAYEASHERKPVDFTPPHLPKSKHP